MLDFFCSGIQFYLLLSPYLYLLTLLYVHSSFAIIMMGKRELVALLSLSSWCLVSVVCLFLAVPWVCMQFVIVVFPDHTHLLFLDGRRSKLLQYNEILPSIIKTI